jgi:hypothetical protein
MLVQQGRPSRALSGSPWSEAMGILPCLHTHPVLGERPSRRGSGESGRQRCLVALAACWLLLVAGLWSPSPACPLSALASGPPPLQLLPCDRVTASGWFPEIVALHQTKNDNISHQADIRDMCHGHMRIIDKHLRPKAETWTYLDHLF